MNWISFQNHYSKKKKSNYRIFGWHLLANKPMKRLITSFNHMKRSIRRHQSVCKKIKKNYWHSMIFLRSTGYIYARLIRLNQHLLVFDIEHTNRRVHFHEQQY